MPLFLFVALLFSILLRLLSQAASDSRIFRRYINPQFVLRLLQSFDCEDERERTAAKTVLHDIYSKFPSLRPHVRKYLGHIFTSFVFDTQKFNGIINMDFSLFLSSSSFSFFSLSSFLFSSLVFLLLFFSVFCLLSLIVSLFFLLFIFCFLYSGIGELLDLMSWIVTYFLFPFSRVFFFLFGLSILLFFFLTLVLSCSWFLVLVLVRFPSLLGIGELLDMMSSIVTGFNVPLKSEHILFLSRCLLPLYRPSSLPVYWTRLHSLMQEYIAKDSTLAILIITYILRTWPQSNFHKEALLISGFKDFFQFIPINPVPPQYHAMIFGFFRRMAASLGSIHFQCSQQAIELIKNEKIFEILKEQKNAIVPMIFPALYMNARSHWVRTEEAEEQERSGEERTQKPKRGMKRQEGNDVLH